MFVDEKCKKCENFFTPYTIKNDQCKCMRKEQRDYNIVKKNKVGFYHQKVNDETRKIQYEIFLSSLKRR